MNIWPRSSTSSLRSQFSDSLLAHLRASRLVFVLVMGRQLVDAVRPELEEVIKHGGKVYAVGGSYSDEERKIGFLHDQKISAYYKTGIPENIKNMVLYALNKDFSRHVRYGEPVMLPDYGVYEPTTKKVFEDVEAFRKVYFQQPSRRGREERPWVGVFFYKNSVECSQTKHLDAVIESLEGRGYNVLPVYGHPPEVAMERFFLSPSQPHVRVIVAIGAKITINPAVAGPLLSRLKAPVINAITLYNQSEQEWRKSPVGLDTLERSWQVAGPETGGMIQPTIIASKEKVADAETGIDYVEDRPIPERIERLAERVRAWINLRDKPNRDKHVALIYYNYPPGKHNIGGAYLNVLPDSLYGIITRLRDENYNTGDGREIGKDRLFNDVHAYGRNIGNWAPGEIDKLVRTGKPVLISVETYKEWFAELPEGFRKSVLKSWGPVEQSSIMTWRGAQGKLYLIIPAVRYGNILLTPQPSRGWEQDTKKLFHDVTLAPHHQYVAFYLWLKKGFKADAVAHIGTHGTHEWLSGKEVGFTDEDPPEALIQDLPNIYPYIVDDVGEGLQAKRRGMAVVIDYMTPPFDRAGLNRELKDLVFLLNDHRATRDKSPSLAATKLHEINVLAKRSGLLTDLKKSAITTETDLVELEDYITEVSEKLTPFGLHTFGTSPDKKYRRSTAEAVLSVEKGLGAEEREKRIAELEERIVHSGQRELDSFVAAFSGQYIPAGQGNDPIRNPDSLPTGKNFYSFDPTRIPAKSTYETGEKLARDLIEGYRQRNGIYPDKLTFNLWATETARHEGVMESQIMYLMGVRPKWDERGRVTGVVAIPRQELGRQRIDVTMVPSGFIAIFSPI